MWLKRLNRIVITAVCVMPLMMLCAVGTAEEDSTSEVVALVNGEVITHFDLQVRARLSGREQELKWRAQQEATPASELEAALEQLYKDILQGVIERRLLVQLANEEEIVVTDEEIETEFERNAKKFGNRANYQAKLKESGLSAKIIKETIREEFLIMRVIQKKTDYDNFVSPADARAYYTKHKDQFDLPPKVRIRQIVIKFNKRTKEEALLLCEAARKRVEDDEDFAEVARELSEGPERGNSGLWELAGINDFVDAIATQIRKLKEGDISPIFAHPIGGFCFIKLEELQQARVKAFEDVQKEIEAKIRQERFHNAMERLSEKLYSEATITVLLK